MNKLEELHKKAIKDSYYTEVYGNVDSYTEFSESTAIEKSAEITKDIATKFALWIDSSSFVYNDEVGIWYNIDNEKKTNEELFDIFINKFYE